MNTTKRKTQPRARTITRKPSLAGRRAVIRKRRQKAVGVTYAGPTITPAPVVAAAPKPLSVDTELVGSWRITFENIGTDANDRPVPQSFGVSAHNASIAHRAAQVYAVLTGKGIAQNVLTAFECVASDTAAKTVTVRFKDGVKTMGLGRRWANLGNPGPEAREPIYVPASRMPKPPAMIACWPSHWH